MTDTPTDNAALDAGAARMLDILRKAQENGTPALHEASPALAREMNLKSKELFGSDGPEMAVVDRNIPGPGGELALRLYRPAEGTRPVIVYYHGGGWVIGSLDTHDGLCRHLASMSGAVVVSVDYRLAPEAPFPAGVEDAYAALAWVAANAVALDVDPARLIVSGDSAGGNLAAVVALMARDQGGPEIAFQALLYPATDMHCTAPSHQLFTQHLLTPESIAWFQSHYLRGDADRDDWRASPACAQSLADLPAALVLTAGFDPLRDEGHAYHEALLAAGNVSTYRCFDGQIHGFLTLDALIPEALDALRAAALAIADALD
ncbi:MAG: alpha/beta hydrolase [Pseudomonadota bacterium]